MAISPASILSSLAGVQDVRAQWSQIDRLRIDATLEFLGLLGSADVRPSGDSEGSGSSGQLERWTVDSVENRAINHLTFDLGVDGVGALTRWFAAIALPLDPKARRVERVIRQTAAGAAQAHGSQQLSSLFPTLEPTLTGASSLFWSNVVQELVLGDDTFDRTAFSSFWDRQAELGNPLAWLPLYRSDLEMSLSHVRVHKDGHSCSVSNASFVEDGDSLRDRPISLQPASYAYERISAAVRSWESESNGRILIDAGVRGTHDDFSAAAALGWLLVEHDQGVVRSSSPVVLDAGSAVATLYTSASAGGAYGSPPCGATGRLLAWTSIGALLGLEDSAPFEAVEDACRHATWIQPGIASTWFEGLLDLQIACSYGGRVACLLAADTD
jgi:Family of unknown function (DUF6183)